MSKKRSSKNLKQGNKSVNLIDDQTSPDILYVYSKKVNNTHIQSDKKTRKIDIEKISKVVTSLHALGKNKFINELEMKQNCKDWVSSIFSSYPKVIERDIRELLYDFTDSMNTRMREDEKYVICIIASKFIILCHSRFGEETITPKWEVIDRMLDKDNILRFVHFEKVRDNIKLTYYEGDSPSVFLADWLGLPEKEAFGYLGGTNKLFGEVNGSTLVFEFTDEDFEKKFLEDKTFQIDQVNRKIILSNPIKEIPLVQISVGRKPYDNRVGDFLQDFLARRYELSSYQEKYQSLNSTVDIWTSTIIDDEYEVRDSKGNIKIRKTNSKFVIIFSNNEISIRPSFLSKLVSKLLNNESLKLFHAGGKVASNPIKIKNMEIFNELNMNTSKVILDYFTNLPVTDIFEKILLYSVFELLSLENLKDPISVFFKNIASGIQPNFILSSKFANSEDSIIELKSREFVACDNEKIVQNLNIDITKKIKKSKNKIYIIGANEDTKQFEPLPISKFNDDRVNDLTEMLKKKTGITNMRLQKIPANNGTECLLMLIIKSEENTKDSP